MPNAGGIEGAGNLNQNINIQNRHSAESFILSKNAEQINNAMNNEKKIPLDALMMAIMVSRAELLESQLREQVDEITKQNGKLKEANNIMATARDAKKDATEDKSTDVPDEVNQFLKDNDIPWGDKDENGEMPETLNSTQWDLLIENMKGWTESLTSTSQLQMTKLQSTSGKYNQTFEMLSQFVSKYYKGGDRIIGNI